MKSKETTFEYCSAHDEGGKLMKRTYRISDEERQRRSARMKALHADPEFAAFPRRMQEDQGEGNIHASLFPPLPLRPPPHENELPKPFVVGKDDGIPNRAHRIKSLGNTIDPEIAEILGGRIYEIERDYL